MEEPLVRVTQLAEGKKKLSVVQGAAEVVLFEQGSDVEMCAAIEKFVRALRLVQRDFS